MSISSISIPPSQNLPFSLHKTRLILLQFHFPSKTTLSFPQKSHFLHIPYEFTAAAYKIQASTPENNQSSRNQEEEEEEEARGVVSEILREFGVSNEESVKIALNSPKYVKMLIDSVRELDELALWSSWNQNAEFEGPLSFKRKLYYMAKEKGDNGKVALLESFGLTLSSAMNVARYLSRETLPGLILKVEYIKEIVCIENDDSEHLVGKKARLMLMHLSIPIDDDIQQTLSFFEKIEARRGGLDVLGSNDVSFQYLLEMYPRLLLLSVETCIKPLVKFLQEISVPRERMRNVLLLFPSIVFSDIEKDIKPRIRIFEKIGVAEDGFGKMLLKYPWILSTSIQENYEKILTFFEMEKVPKASVARAIKSWPLILGCSTSKLKVMVDQISEIGIQNKKLGQVIASSPQLLLQKPQEFLKVVSFLEDIGFDRDSISQVLARCPEIFATNIEKTLIRKIDFLANIGISKEHIPRVIKKYPELLVSDVEKTLLPRINYLMKRGFSKRDISFMICRFSPILGYSIDEVLRPKLDFLVTDMKKPIRDAVDYPRYLSYSLEKKIKPRFSVLNRRKVQCNLKEMLAKNDDEFATEFLGLERMLVPPPLSYPSQ